MGVPIDLKRVPVNLLTYLAQVSQPQAFQTVGGNVDTDLWAGEAAIGESILHFL